MGEALQAAAVRALKSRGLTQATCDFWDYRVRQRPNGDYEQLAPYRDRETRQLVGVKVRNVGADGTGKEFYWIGSAKGQLWGAEKWPAGGKKLTVIEGEIDCQTVSQANNHKWPVVSVPNGAAEAAKCIAKNLEYVSSFEEVIFGFDMDEPGREAAIACAKLLPPGKAKIAKWSKKDPNEMLTKGDGGQITLAIFKAETYRPDGILDARTLTQACLTPPEWGLPWPWKFLTDWTYGRRKGEVITFGAGSGIGKTDIIAETIAATITGQYKDGQADHPPEGVGVFSFEGGGAAMTKKRVAGKVAGRRFHIPLDPDFPAYTAEELKDTLLAMDGDIWDRGGKLFINDHKGSSDWERVVDRIRYIAHAEGVLHFFVDPISKLVAGAEDERKMLDNIVDEAAGLAEELGVTLYLGSHLTRPKEGPGHEDGGQVHLNQFRGSNGIGMYSDFVLGLERNKNAESQEERTRAVLRMVKDRFTGNSDGETAGITYDVITGSYDVPVTKFLGDE